VGDVGGVDERRDGPDDQHVDEVGEVGEDLVG
jgi:hypothetical protein